MYVCICNAITDSQIRKAAKNGAKDLWDLQAELGVGGNCGSCKETAAEILRGQRAETQQSHAQPTVYRPATA